MHKRFQREQELKALAPATAFFTGAKIRPMDLPEGIFLWLRLVRELQHCMSGVGQKFVCLWRVQQLPKERAKRTNRGDAVEGARSWDTRPCHERQVATLSRTGAAQALQNNDLWKCRMYSTRCCEHWGVFPIGIVRSNRSTEVGCCGVLRATIGSEAANTLVSERNPA
jgi:hypothetical protein